jgi:NitT/TauT family transport system permease protein
MDTTSAATIVATTPVEGHRAPRKRKKPSGLIRWIGPVVVFVGLIGVWSLVAKHYADQGLPWIIPYPKDVLTEAFLDADARSQLLTALGRTTVVTITGLGIAVAIGMAWAILMAQAKWIEQSLYPYAVVLQCVPILALVPLVSSIADYGFRARVIVTVMIALFPIVSNTLFGLQSAEKPQRELFRLQSANRLTVLQKLTFPVALPAIFIGLRTSAGLAVIGSVVADQFFQRGSPGLGVLIQVSASRLNGTLLFAAIITASALGIAVFLIFGLLGKLAVGKWHDFS